MRSEQEILDKIDELVTREKLVVKEMEEANSDGNHYMLGLHIQKANVIQSQRLILEWVLNKNNI